ncbi:MAG: pantetheine-phosphate adenylyltransferase [Ardenticatenaceae bacterium]|nr:pantetheine-phosphate adenylyltransferase [Ardenticatenaceae bacterium]
MTKAVYPGTFDPITNGQIDIALRTARLFSHVVVGVYARPAANILFSAEERLTMVRETFNEIPNITVASYDGLTVDFARSVGALAIVRGLRVVSDFEHEFQMALMSRKLAPDIDFVCLMTSVEHTYLSSSIVKEVAMLGGNIEQFVPCHVAEALRARLENLGELSAQKVDMISLKNG